MSVTRPRADLNRSARAFGCRLDGSDMSVRLQAALDAGPGTVELPPIDTGILGLADPVSIPSGVNLIAPGGNSHGAAVTIKALASDAVLNFGARLTGSYGGLSGGFCLDGNNLAPTMLYLGRTLERSFVNIGIKNCASGGPALLIEEAQNNQFFGLLIDTCAGDGIAFDRGCGGNRFYGVETTAIGSAAGGGMGGAAPAHVRFTATATGITSLNPWPMNNQFFGGIFERDGGNLGAVVYHGAGADNQFWGVNLAAGAPTRAFPLIKVGIGNAGITTQSTRLTFHGSYFTGSQTWTTWIDVNGASTIRINGKPLVQGFLNTYLLRDASSLIHWPVGDDPVISNVTNTLDAASVGTIGQVGPGLLPKMTVHATDNNALMVENAAGTDLFNVNTNSGVLQCVNGMDFTMFSDNYTTSKFSVDAATGYVYFGSINVATPGIRFGTGSPEGVVTAPVGSLFLRTDGSAGSTIYSKESGSGNTGWGAR